MKCNYKEHLIQQTREDMRRYFTGLKTNYQAINMGKIPFLNLNNFFYF